MQRRSKEQDLISGGIGSRGTDSADEGTPTGARFVALQMAQRAPASVTTIELMGQNGDRMRVEVSGALDVVGLVHRFWSRRS